MVNPDEESDQSKSWIINSLKELLNIVYIDPNWLYNQFGLKKIEVRLRT